MKTEWEESWRSRRGDFDLEVSRYGHPARFNWVVRRRGESMRCLAEGLADTADRAKFLAIGVARVFEDADERFDEEIPF
jgi:hypothetical protein